MDNSTTQGELPLTSTWSRLVDHLMARMNTDEREDLVLSAYLIDVIGKKIILLSQRMFQLARKSQ